MKKKKKEMIPLTHKENKSEEQKVCYMFIAAITLNMKVMEIKIKLYLLIITLI